MSLVDRNKNDAQREVSYKNDSNSKRAPLLNSSKYIQGNVTVQQEINPDVIPNRHKAQVIGPLNQPKHNSSGKKDYKMYHENILRFRRDNLHF